MGKRVLIIKMIEVQKGIYRMDGELEKVSDRSLVLVHPWYDEGHNSFRLYEGTGSYKDNLDKLIELSFVRNLILFEEIDICGKTFKKVRSIRKSQKGLYIVPTIKGDPFPKYSSWQVVLNFLKSVDTEFNLAGGYLTNGSNGLGGCAGHFGNILIFNAIRVKFLKDCCFTR